MPGSRKLRGASPLGPTGELTVLHRPPAVCHVQARDAPAMHFGPEKSGNLTKNGQDKVKIFGDLLVVDTMICTQMYPLG